MVNLLEKYSFYRVTLIVGLSKILSTVMEDFPKYGLYVKVVKAFGISPDITLRRILDCTAEAKSKKYKP